MISIQSTSHLKHLLGGVFFGNQGLDIFFLRGLNFLYCFSILFLELLPKLFFSLTNYVPKNSSSFKSVDFVLCCLRNNILKEKLVQFPELNRAQGLTVLILRTHAFFLFSCYLFVLCYAFHSDLKSEKIAIFLSLGLVSKVYDKNFERK